MPFQQEKLNGLNPIFRGKVDAVIVEMEKRGWNIRIVWGKRTYDENYELVKKGVASLTSKHLDGEAVDLIDRNVGYSSDPAHKYYRDLSEIARREGLKWGGDFSTRWDPCHIELP